MLKHWKCVGLSHKLCPLTNGELLTAHAIVALPVPEPRAPIRTAVHGSTNIGNLATYNSWEEPPTPPAQVAALLAALDSAREYVRHSEGCNYPYGAMYGCKCGLLRTLTEIDAALAAAPDPNAPSLDDFTHWPFLIETAVTNADTLLAMPPAGDAQDGAE